MKVQTQPDNYSCGIYAIINALIVYGEKLTRDKLLPLTKTTKNGTTEKNIQKAILELGYKYRIYKTTNKDNAWKWVLNNKNPIILYVDNNHWVTIAGRIKNKVILIDNCTEILNKEELLSRWKPYWGMSIYR